MGNQVTLLYAIAAAAIAVYIPFGIVALTRLQAGMDYSAPRGMFDKLPEYGKRATWAHQNGFESFGLFAAACLMVYVSGKYTDWTGTLAIVHVVSRLGFSTAYILNWPFVRSGFWALSMACVGALMLSSFS